MANVPRTDRQLSELLQRIDNSEMITLDMWECDFMESFQMARRLLGSSRTWWTDNRRDSANRMIEKYEALL